MNPCSFRRVIREWHNPRDQRKKKEIAETHFILPVIWLLVYLFERKLFLSVMKVKYRAEKYTLESSVKCEVIYFSHLLQKLLWSQLFLCLKEN